MTFEERQPKRREFFIVAAEVSSSYYKDRAPLWLYLSPGDWGPSHTFGPAGAMEFQAPPSRQVCASWSGKPWMDVHTGKYRIFRVIERVFVQELEALA